MEKQLKINEKLKSFINSEDSKRHRYRSLHFEHFRNDDGTSNIAINPNETLEVGDDFRDYRGRLHIITEIVGERPHKGIFQNEADRQRIIRVKSEIYPNM